MSAFSERLSFLIKRAGITQARFASDINITPQAASNYVKGREPDFELLIKISRYFNVTTDFLLGISDKEKISIENYSDVAQILLALMTDGELSCTISTPSESIQNVDFAINNSNCNDFFVEFSRMYKLLANGSISKKAFGAWLGVELSELQKVELPKAITVEEYKELLKNAKIEGFGTY